MDNRQKIDRQPDG